MSSARSRRRVFQQPVNKLFVSHEAGGGKITVPELLKHYADEFEYAAVDVHAAAEALTMINKRIKICKSRKRQRF